jgi:hypothetical protein
MNRPQLRLLIAALLFAGWIGYLAYLALFQAKPVVVSRWQMTSATHAVVGKLEPDASGHPVIVRVEQVLPAGAKDGPPVGENLRLPGLTSARLAGTADKLIAGGDGLYLIPLAKDEEGSFHLADFERSPGVDGQSSSPLIYRWTPETEQQARELLR